MPTHLDSGRDANDGLERHSAHIRQRSSRSRLQPPVPSLYIPKFQIPNKSNARGQTQDRGKKVPRIIYTRSLSSSSVPDAAPISPRSLGSKSSSSINSYYGKEELERFHSCYRPSLRSKRSYRSYLLAVRKEIFGALGGMATGLLALGPIGCLLGAIAGALVGFATRRLAKTGEEFHKWSQKGGVVFAY